MGRLPWHLCCLFLSLSSLAAAATVHQEWEISYQFKSPDCVRKLAVTINGLTPGPTIRATQGDTVVVRVKNSLLTENVAIHWHGIRQHGTPWADGTEGVTQCPVLPGDTFTYTFVVDRPGTYMYHAHYGMQRSAGLNGLIVVAAAKRGGGPDAAEPFAYDGEHEVLLNDWWHKSTYKQAAGLASVPIGWVGEPQSLLINGRGKFNCSAAEPGTCNATSPECAAPVFAVVPGKTYRFRIASVTSLCALNFEIERGGGGGGPDAEEPWADGTEGVTKRPVLPGDTFTYTFVVDCPGTYMYHAHYGMQRSAGLNLNGLIVVAARRGGGGGGGGRDAEEPFAYDGEHEVLLNDWWHKSTYEQSTGLASVPIGWIGEPQSLLINGRGKFNFDIEDRIARLIIGYPATPVASDATSSRRPLIGYALVVVTTFFATLLATGGPLADQNPETAGESIEMSAPPAPSVSGSLPAAGGNAPPPSSTSASSPSTSSGGDPAGGAGTGSSNPSDTLSTPRSTRPVGTVDERPSSPHRSRPRAPSDGTPDEGQLSAFLLSFVALGFVMMVAILNVGFERILGDWTNRGAKVAYKVSAWLATVFLALAVFFIAAWYSASSSSMARNPRLLSIAEAFAKAGVILFVDLLVVIPPCSMGRGACVAAMPSVAVISFLIATVGIWGRIINSRILGPRRRRPHTGDDMV